MPVGVWTLHPRSCSDCGHRWHYDSKCRRNLSLRKWQQRNECNCPKATKFTIKKAMEYIKQLNNSPITLRGKGN